MASAAQAPPYFGRAWKITADAADGTHLVISSDQFDDALRVTFTIDMFMLLTYWQATVTIYNLSNEAATKIWQGNTNFGPKPGGLLDSRGILRQQQPFILGDVVTISGGYQSGISGKFDASTSVLYCGKVLQPIWTRENVVDYKLTLRLTTGLPEDAHNFASFPLEKGVTDYEKLTQVCGLANTPIPIDKIDDDAKAELGKQTYPRSQVVHSRPYDVLREIMRQHSLFAWVKPIDPATGIGGLNVRKFDPNAPAQTPDYAYAPPNLEGQYTTDGTMQGLVKKTLIGTPEQTQDGVLFRVLLDPLVRIGDIVQLAPGTIVNPYPLQYGAVPPAAPLVNGLYTVAGIRHVGDTRGRGDDWYTEIQGLVPNFFASYSETRKQS